MAGWKTRKVWNTWPLARFSLKKRRGTRSTRSSNQVLKLQLCVCKCRLQILRESCCQEFKRPWSEKSWNLVAFNRPGFCKPKVISFFSKTWCFFLTAVANVNDKDSRCQNVELWTFFQVCNSSVFKLRKLAVYNVYTSISGAKFQRSTFKSKKEFAYRMCTLSYVSLNYSTLSYSALRCFSLNYSSLSYSLLEWNCWVRAICIVNIFSNASAYIGPLFAHRSFCSPMSEDQFDSFLLATNINGLLHILMAFGSSWLRFAFARPLSPELQVIIWYIPSKQCRYEQCHFINFNAMVDQSHGAHICIYTHHHKPRYSLR